MSQTRGQTLLEMLVAIAIVGVVMTAIVAVISMSVRNTSRARAKVIGEKYTQEGIEYFRAQRNLMGWEAFWATIQHGEDSTHYCLASLPYSPQDGLTQLPNRACQLMEFVDVHNLYKRIATVTIATVSGQPTATITVQTTWPDGAQTTTSEATLELQQSQN